MTRANICDVCEKILPLRDRRSPPAAFKVTTVNPGGGIVAWDVCSRACLSKLADQQSCACGHPPSDHTPRKDRSVICCTTCLCRDYEDHPNGPHPPLPKPSPEEYVTRLGVDEQGRLTLCGVRGTPPTHACRQGGTCDPGILDAHARDCHVRAGTRDDVPAPYEYRDWRDE